METEISKNKSIQSKKILNMISIINKNKYEFDLWKEDVLKVIRNQNDENYEMKEEIKKLYLVAEDLRLTLDNIDKFLTDKDKEIHDLAVELDQLTLEFNLSQQTFDNIKHQCKKTENEPLISSADKEIFELSREKLSLYKLITNIIWDFSVPILSGKASGFVCNRDINYIHAFEIKRSKNKEIWKEVEQGSGQDWSDIVAMTNVKSKTKK